MDYYQKYIKYKTKYMNLLQQGGDNSADFQFLIDTIGAPNILQDFAYFLGRSDMKVAESPTDKNRVSTRAIKGITMEFSGVGFSGAHWKGYESSKSSNKENIPVYDSYKENIQLPKTNNYCQSYATYLWASKGLINKTHKVELIAGDYRNNVIKMSNLWLKYFQQKNTAWMQWLLSALINQDKKDHNRIINILNKLTRDESYADEFTKSAE
jgi:hypothetical protein